MDTPKIITAVLFTGIGAIGCGSDSSLLLGACETESVEYEHHNNERSIEITTEVCPLASNYTVINYRENKDTDLVEIFKANTGLSSLDVEWYFLKHAKIKGTVETMREIDLQTIVINGVKIEYLMTEGKPISKL